MQPTSLDNLTQNFIGLDESVDPLLRAALQTAVTHYVPNHPSDVIFTDERAPVETIIDSLVLRYLLSEGVGGLPGIEQ
jgi:hypothetical protein